MSTPVRYHEGGFPPSELDWARLVSVVGLANAAVARYDGLLSAIPDAAVLLSPLTTQEAVLSSRIEGTQATMGEVLEYEAKGDTSDVTSPKAADIWEVLNCRLYNRMKTHFVDLTHSQYAIHALDWIFERPIFKSSDFVASSPIPKPTVSRILNVLKQEGVLKEREKGSGRRASVLAYAELLNIAEGHHAF